MYILCSYIQPCFVSWFLHSVIYSHFKGGALDLKRVSDATDQQILNTNEDCEDTDEVLNVDMWVNNYREAVLSQKVLQRVQLSLSVVMIDVQRKIMTPLSLHSLVRAPWATEFGLLLVESEETIFSQECEYDSSGLTDCDRGPWYFLSGFALAWSELFKFRVNMLTEG